MARFACPLQYAGIVVAVFGLGKLHAVRHVYDYTGSYRFGWSAAYVILLAVSSYSVGLPEVLRTRRAAWAASVTACVVGALGVSVAQLLTNSVLLPRLVVFGAGLILVPWFAFCATLARHARAGQRIERGCCSLDGSTKGSCSPTSSKVVLSGPPSS